MAYTYILSSEENTVRDFFTVSSVESANEQPQDSE